MSEINVAWEDVVRFVRQLNHDIRNHLNAVELQAAFLNEIASDAEVKEEIKRLRETLGTLAGMLQKLSGKLLVPSVNAISYPAADLMADLRKKFERDHRDRSARVTWKISVTGESIDVDPQLLQEALFELLDNAFDFSSGDASFTIEGKIADGKFAITLREPKAADARLTTGAWAREPLRNVRHGHYGLGLNRLRAIIEAHGGTLDAKHDAAQGALVTTILLPVSAAKT